MNPLDLIKGILGVATGNSAYETIAKVCQTTGATVVAIDSNNTGADDLAGGAIVVIGDAFSAYAKQDNNEHGNVVDALIAGLQQYRTQAVRCGLITNAAPQA